MTTTRSATDRLRTVLPYIIEGSACGNCGAELAWRSGVGRVVITHAHGDDRCSSTIATLTQSDKSLAQAAINTVDFLLTLGKNAN